MTKALAFGCLSNAWGVREGNPEPNTSFLPKISLPRMHMDHLITTFCFYPPPVLTLCLVSSRIINIPGMLIYPAAIDIHEMTPHGHGWVLTYTREIKTPTHLIFVKHPFFFSSNIKRKIQPLIIMPQTQRTLRCAIQLPLEFESDHSCIKSKITLARMLSS